MPQLSKEIWFSIFIAILTGGLSIGIIHLWARYGEAIVDTNFLVLPLFLITFIIITVSPYLGPVHFLSKAYKASVDLIDIGSYGVFFYPLALMFSFGTAYMFLVWVQIDWEVLLFAFTGGIMMLMMRGFLRFYYKFITSAGIRWNTFLIGMISGVLSYWMLIRMPEIDLILYPINLSIAYGVFLIGLNLALILSLRKTNFKLINILLMLFFLALLFDIFANKDFESILELNIVKPEYF